MKTSKYIRDGLTDWHYQYCRSLLVQILSYGPIRHEDYGSATNLLVLLAEICNLSQRKIADVSDILAVTRTASGISFHKSSNGVPVELAINFGGLERYEAGAEFEEYARFADDPVIGSRWAQNVDAAILLTLGHELAHYVVALKGDQPTVKPHGEAFQRVYRVIRQCVVNPMLDEFGEAEHQRASARFEARLIKKIHALKKMAEDETSNENEAERALVQLQALMLKHGLTDVDGLTVGTSQIVERTVPIMGKDGYKPLLHICWSIAKFCGVEPVIHTVRLDPKTGDERESPDLLAQEYLTYFGAVADTEMAVYLSELAFRSLFDESRRYRQSTAYRQEQFNGHHHRTLISSFRRAFVERLNRRLSESREAVEQKWVSARASNKDLMAQKDARLRSLFKSKYPRLATARARESAASTVGSAYSAGSSAADRVNIRRPTSRDRREALVKIN